MVWGSTALAGVMGGCALSSCCPARGFWKLLLERSFVAYLLVEKRNDI